ncbi:MAG: hypothetical protein J4400_04305 [Candidatus Aenigmarchaeota archaeon]|nr:hypothetical protein [Candidatus Aenigmarchaeota archaeon]
MNYRKLLVAVPFLASIACGNSEPPKGVKMYSDMLFPVINTQQWVDYDKRRTFNDFNSNGTLDMVCSHDKDGCVYIVDRKPEFQGEIYFGEHDEIVSRTAAETREETASFTGDFEDTKAKHKKQIEGR